jgi:hypothetical protein
VTRREQVTYDAASGIVTNRLLYEIREALIGPPSDTTRYRDALTRICDLAEPESEIERIAWEALNE